MIPLSIPYTNYIFFHLSWALFLFFFFYPLWMNVGESFNSFFCQVSFSLSQTYFLSSCLPFQDELNQFSFFLHFFLLIEHLLFWRSKFRQNYLPLPFSVAVSHSFSVSLPWWGSSWCLLMLCNNLGSISNRWQLIGRCVSMDYFYANTKCGV